MGKTDCCLTITNHVNERNICVILGMYWPTELPPNVTDDTLRRIMSSLCDKLGRLRARFQHRYGYYHFVSWNEFLSSITTVGNEANMPLIYNHLHDNILIHSYNHLQLFNPNAYSILMSLPNTAHSSWNQHHLLQSPPVVKSITLNPIINGGNYINCIIAPGYVMPAIYRRFMRTLFSQLSGPSILSKSIDN